MKNFLFVLNLEKALHAQALSIYTITADSVKITNDCDTAELIIENPTQNVKGLLYNKGKGRTEFRRATKLDDSTIVPGSDTIVIQGGMSYLGSRYTDNESYVLAGNLATEMSDAVRKEIKMTL